jgi:hypothetical protein
VQPSQAGCYHLACAGQSARKAALKERYAPLGTEQAETPGSMPTGRFQSPLLTSRNGLRCVATRASTKSSPHPSQNCRHGRPQFTELKQVIASSVEANGGIGTLHKWKTNRRTYQRAERGEFILKRDECAEFRMILMQKHRRDRLQTRYSSLQSQARLDPR